MSVFPWEQFTPFQTRLVPTVILPLTVNVFREEVILPYYSEIIFFPANYVTRCRKRTFDTEHGKQLCSTSHICYFASLNTDIWNNFRYVKHTSEAYLQRFELYEEIRYKGIIQLKKSYRKFSKMIRSKVVILFDCISFNLRLFYIYLNTRFIIHGAIY